MAGVPGVRATRRVVLNVTGESAHFPPAARTDLRCAWGALEISCASLAPPSRLPLPESALCVAFLHHAALVAGHRHVVTDQHGRKKDSLRVHVLARSVVEVELCVRRSRSGPRGGASGQSQHGDHDGGPVGNHRWTPTNLRQGTMVGVIALAQISPEGSKSGATVAAPYNQVVPEWRAVRR